MADQFRTAYEEALASIDSEDGSAGLFSAARTSSLVAPSYLVAADNHSIANGNKTFIESAVDTISSVPKFIGLSLISGVNQIYNIPTDIGNLFGADFERSNIDDFVAALDSDLGQYYSEHKEGVDTLGFIASSIIPGSFGIKALHAGQASLKASLTAEKFGENMSKALGLLVPESKLHLNAAIKEAVNSNSIISLANRNLFNALRAGGGQAFLEAAAFETVVAATLFKSPVLEDQDFGDYLSNIMWGGLVFGTIGGAISGTKSYFSFKRQVSEADREAMPWRFIDDAPTKAQPFEKISLDIEQLHTIPPIPDTVDEARKAFLTSSAADKVNNLQLRIRKETTNITGGDQELATILHESTKNLSYADRIGTFVGLKQAARLTEKTGVEKDIKVLKRLIRKKDADITQVEKALNLNIAYAKIWGDDAGKVVTSSPSSSSLVDTLKRGQKIEVNFGGVTAGKLNYKFSPKVNSETPSWNIYKSNPLEAQARYIWASKLPKFDVSGIKKVIVHENDLPMMEKVYREFSPKIEIKAESGDKLKFADSNEFLKFLEGKKVEVANKLHEETSLGNIGIRDTKAVVRRLQELLDTKNLPDITKTKVSKMMETYKKRAAQLTQEDIATMTNVRSAFLGGQFSENILDDIFALERYSKDYTKKLVDSGARKESEGLVNVWEVPQHIKLAYDTTGFQKLSGHEVENVIALKRQQKIYMQGTDRASAVVLGEDHAKFPDISQRLIQDTANRLGAGAKLVTAASANYGTLGAISEFIGKTTVRAIEKFQAATRESLEPALYALSQNQKAVLEWGTLSNRLRSIPDNYALNEAGNAFVPKVLKDWEIAARAANVAGKTIPERPTLIASDAPLKIAIENKEVARLAKLHIELNGKRVDNYRTLRAAQGIQHNSHSDVFYPPPVNPKEYPFFALVSDESITGTGHTKTLYAASERELESMIAKLKTVPGLKIRVKADAEDYYKSIGQFDYEKTLNDNYLNTTMHRKGISSSYTVPTDPQKVVSDLLSWHMQKEAGLVREAVSTKYEVPFNELKTLGDNFTKQATSKFSKVSLVKYADNVVKNPFGEYVKTALGIKNYADYPWWVSVNRLVDEKVSTMYSKITSAFDSARTTDELLPINETLKEYGYKGAAYDEAMDIFANHSAPRGVLTSFIQKANSLLATVVLRLDTLNAVNNAVSASVLLGAESKAVIRAIERGDSEAVGALAALAKINVPGTDKSILSPSKLISNSIKKFGTDTSEMAFYKENGFVTTISEQYRQTLDKLAVSGKETISQLNSKVDDVFNTLRNAGNTGEKWTGNRLAEEFNRFVAADVMTQISDIAVAKGYMTAKEQLAYINTFVNRTQGNYFSAQRPMLFQGPIGQAIGLFQTYQFNLMQQLFRHVGEGHTKDAMTLLALQGTIHGMNGLPAFNAINTHIVGNASGNSTHKDLYDTVYGAAGKDAGNWLMYGVGSNFLLHPDLKVNLYVRGDINPRHVTIVPTDPSAVPIVQATKRFFSNLFDTVGKLQAGGDVTNTLLQGLEHNGISRPLAGLAQTLEGLASPIGRSYSTSSRGNVIASNDLLSLANLGRIVGGKPLDEAIALDAAFRFKSYGLEDAKRKQKLGEAIKSTIIAGNTPSTEQIENFVSQYTALGGKQEQFNKWFLQLYKAANLSQVNKISQDLNGTFSQSMQKIMGGYELRDFHGND